MSSFLFEKTNDLSINDESINATKLYNSQISFYPRPRFKEANIKGKIPRNVYVSSEERSRKLEHLRNKLRINSFDHMKYDPQLQSKACKRYFEGIYEPNARLDDDN